MSWTDDQLDGGQELRKDLVEMILLNKERKVRIKVELRDEHGDVVPVSKVSKDLLEYVQDKFDKNAEGEDNSFVSQIYPMLANILASTLGTGLDPNLAAVILTNNLVKESFMMTMSVSFLLLQYIKQNNYSINTVEEPLTDDQIENYNTRTLISSIAGKAAMLGVDFKTAVAIVWSQGNMTLDQAGHAFGYAVTEDELRELANLEPKAKDTEDDDTN